MWRRVTGGLSCRQRQSYKVATVRDFILKLIALMTRDWIRAGRPGVDSQHGYGYFFSPRRPDQPWGPPRGKMAETWSRPSPPSSAEVENEWSLYLYNPHTPFGVVLNHWYNFTLHTLFLHRVLSRFPQTALLYVVQLRSYFDLRLVQRAALPPCTGKSAYWCAVKSYAYRA